MQRLSGPRSRRNGRWREWTPPVRLRGPGVTKLVRQSQGIPLVGAHLVEGQHLDTADRAPALDDSGDIVDVLRVVRQARNQHESGPDLDPLGRQTVTEGDGRGQGAPRHLLVGLLVTALDVEQDQVDVIEHLVTGIGTQES